MWSPCPRAPRPKRPARCGNVVLSVRCGSCSPPWLNANGGRLPAGDDRYLSEMLSISYSAGSTASVAEAQQEVAEAQHDLDGDEADDVPFEPHAALCLHHVEDGADGLVDERELALHAAAALGELVLVLEPRVESLELGMVPQHVGLLLDLDAPDHAVLRQQHAADLLQQAMRLRAGAAGALQPVGQRLDPVEGFGDAALVMREDQALRQHVGDDLQSLGRGFAQRNAARGIDLILAAGLDQDLHLVSLRRRRRIDDARPASA